MLSATERWTRWEIATAAIRAGIVVCPCTTLAVAHDIKYRAQVSEASIFVGDSVSVERFRQVSKDCPNVRNVIQAAGPAIPGVLQYDAELVDVAPDALFNGLGEGTKWSDPSMIYFTSGTTGMPKMVQHNQVSYPLGNTSRFVDLAGDANNTKLMH